MAHRAPQRTQSDRLRPPLMGTSRPWLIRTWGTAIRDGTGARPVRGELVDQPAGAQRGVLATRLADQSLLNGSASVDGLDISLRRRLLGYQAYMTKQILRQLARGPMLAPCS